MIKELLKEAVEKGNIEWSAHALRTMFERNISREAVKKIVCTGEIIESYPQDRPFPSFLLFGFWRNLPLHAVVAYDASGKWLYVITAYVPDEIHFESGWKIRRVK